MILINKNKTFKTDVTYKSEGKWVKFLCLTPYVFQFPKVLGERLLTKPVVWRPPTQAELDELKSKIVEAVEGDTQAKIDEAQKIADQKRALLDDPDSDDIAKRLENGEDVDGTQAQKQLMIENAKKNAPKTWDEKVRFLIKGQEKLNLNNDIKPAFKDIDKDELKRILNGNRSMKKTYIDSLTLMMGQDYSEKVIDELISKIVS